MRIINYRKLLSVLVALSIVMSLGIVSYADELEVLTPSEVEPEDNVDVSSSELTDESEPSLTDVVEQDYESTEESIDNEVIIYEESSYDDLYSVNGYTRDSAVSWALAKIGRSYSTFWDTTPNNGNYLCSEYASALGNSYRCYTTQDYLDHSIPSGWSKVYCDYQRGDIAVWKNNLEVISGFSTISTDNEYGHCGIIVECDEYGFYAVEAFERADGTWNCDISKNYHYYSELLFAVRPDFQGLLDAGWRVENNVRRYYNSYGNRLYGLQYIDGYYYYLLSDGVYTGGWKAINGSWYYFQSNGQAFANTTRTIGGKNYTFNSSGICTNRVAPVDMYRLYNPNSGEHFYTSSIEERNVLIDAGWNYEGVGWIAPATSSTPVYRLYNPYAGEHHYTTSVDERNNLISVGWNDEGIGWYSDENCSIPLYRQYNPNEYANNHNYTTSQEENNYLISIGWRGEGVGWYGVG